MRNFKNLLIIGSAMAFLLILWAPPVRGDQEEEPSVGVLFIQAFENKDEKAMRELIKTRTNEFPPEVKDMVGYAMSPNAAPEEQDFIMNIAGTIAMMYGEHTGDERLLGAVRANHQKLMGKRRGNALPEEGVRKVKSELAALGDNNWRISSVKLVDEGLIIEIEVHADAKGSAFTPHINFKKSQKAKEIVQKNLPKIKKGKISWSSMGIGLKAVFLD